MTGYILLADDNATDAELTIRALEIGGVGAAGRVGAGRRGGAALRVPQGRVRATRRRAIHASMLLDLHMPKVDGLDVLAQIKARSAHALDAGVIMSSSDQESDMVRSYAAHANSYIVKPVDFKQFTEQVRCSGSTGPASTAPDRDEP